jgi:ubiquitin-like-conjugating enzyme ATG3
MQALQSQFWTIRDYLSPVLKESKFKESGCITPEEFVLAGDFLVYKFPVWSWKTGDESKIRDFLPQDKQYLITTGVPCLRRATALAYTDADEDAERLLSFSDSSAVGGGEEWVETHANRKHATGDSAANAGEIADIPDLDGPHDNIAGKMGGLSLGGADDGLTPDIDDIPDMEEEGLEEGDEATAAQKKPAPVANEGQGAPTKNTNLVQVRTYDVMITYDKYYQTPRVWLIGYDEKRRSLTPQQIFQDISTDHANKTVTIEPFIHSTSLQAASVHPCKHSSVMKKVIERMNNSVVAEQLAQRKKDSKDGKKKWLFGRKPGSSEKDSKKAPPTEEEEVEGMRVDFYLIVFLKFIASIVPTIEVDSTTAF